MRQNYLGTKPNLPTDLYQPNLQQEDICCHWPSLQALLIAQWHKLSWQELTETGPQRQRIALLVEQKYGIAAPLVENYIRNIERTLPADPA